MPAYSLRIAVGVMLALAWLWQHSSALEMSRQRVALWLWALAGGALVAGRAGYVLAHRAYFAQHPLAVLHLRSVGGIHGGGAFLVGIGVLLLWSWMERRRLVVLVNWLAPAALLVAAGAWWGCRAAGCAAGREVTVTASRRASWWIVEAPDLYHVVRPRYATQRLGMLWALGLAALAMIGWRARVCGRCGVWALALYCAGAAGLSCLRGESLCRWGPLCAATWLYIGLALLLVSLAMGTRKYRGEYGRSKL